MLRFVQIKRRWIKIIFFIFGMLVVFAALLILSVQSKQKLQYGVTFSQKFASEFGFDWKVVYLDILDGLKIEDARLIAYWDLLEPNEGEFRFEDLDWQVKEAEKRGVKIVLALGRKTPRWPECHNPAWTRGEYMEVQPPYEFVLRYIREVIEHYRSNQSIIAWQIENEPLFPFGECGTVGVELLNKEIELVKSLDSRPIILTDSGELGFAWPYLAFKGDIFGTTLYRYVHNRATGDIKYWFIPASYFRLKAGWAKLLGKEIIISELQAEPWASEFLGNVPLERQYQTMNTEIFNEVIEYAERSGFPKAYLWGVEWWYWLKVKQDKPEIWDNAKTLFSTKQ